jgi:phospholipase/carboxylesterase
MSELLPHVELETHSSPNASVIWLHGLGADGHDFEPIVAQLDLPADAAIRFIFPHAPSLPITINNGMVMPAWYDIVEMKIDREIDEPQLKKSASEVNRFIEHELKRGIDSHRIIIAGFSQGGAVAFESALSFTKPLGGLLTLSTYFATKDSIVYAPENQQLPIAIHHGEFDPIVPMSLGEASHALLASKGYDVTLKRYHMEHSVCRQQIADIREWLVNILDL